MAWMSSSGDDSNTNQVLVSRSVNIRILREERIPVGYNLTTWQLDENGNRVVDEDGEYVRVTEFHQTGTVVIICKVRETTTVWEWRAVTQGEAANLSGSTLGGVAAGNTMHGHTFTQGLCSVFVPNCNGAITTVNARRANDANGWIVTKTEVKSEPL